ncbi:unnamed protein product [marine sediment metagenome]|uniref:Uncharacterized protein n=1 Tax=marine sediment metagenome TaxID=412755 RepID=X1I4D8_9ZZZZ
MTVHVLPIWVRNLYDCLEVNTTSNTGKYRELSPFMLPAPPAKNLENLWQFSKVYLEHLVDDVIQPVWFQWRDNGWVDKRAHRYPMGKGRKPEFSYWNGGGEVVAFVLIDKEGNKRYIMYFGNDLRVENYW